MAVGPLGVLIMVLFVIAGGYFLVRLVLDRRHEDRILDLSHVLMSAAMIIMPFNWSSRIPAVLPTALFTAAALWYGYLTLFRPEAASENSSGHHSGRPRLVYHAAMMLAMVWMSVIMAPLPSAGADALSGHSMRMSGMSGMAGVSGDAHSTMAATAGGTPVVLTRHGWADPITILSGCGFAAAAVWFTGRFVVDAGRAGAGVRAGSPRRLADLGAAALMAAGMALDYLVVMA